MNSHNDHVHTPIFIKSDANLPLPDGVPVFHLLTRDGLFLCRNHPFFRSSVRVEQFPSELAPHQPFLKMRYPKLPRKLVEQVVGFFAIVGRRYASEAAVLLAWDKSTETVVAIVPEQIGLVGGGWYGDPFPMELQYEIPPLPPNLTLIGDMHSHVDGPAYASSMDKADEEYRAGLHIVVGRIRHEPPEFHCEVTVDGARFTIPDLDTVIAGYQRRREREVPPEWLDKLTVKSWSSSAASYVVQAPRQSSPEIHDAAVVDKPGRETLNGNAQSDVVATLTAPLKVPERTESSTQDKP
jgi:hypothetical protein